MSSKPPGMLINLPPPQSDPSTPYEQGPGTPNSGTTSLSQLSVVAIKDGAAGQNPHSHFHSRNQPSGQQAQTLEAERNDRISRLAGLERVATVRQTPSGNIVPGAGPQHGASGGMLKEISTVGTASATGSVGGQRSESMDYDVDNTDKMSEDTAPYQDIDDGEGVETSSMGGGSDTDKASLVGFGEGAGSTMSGPVNTANARLLAARNMSMNSNPNFVQSPTTPRGHSALQSEMMPGQGSGGSTPMSGIETEPMAGHGQQGSRFSGVGADMAESVMRDRIDDLNPRTLETPPNQQSLGRFGFERD